MSERPDTFGARLAAAKLVRGLGIASPSEIAIEEIAWMRGVHVIDGGVDGAEARLVRAGAKGLIRVRSGLPEEGRRRFAIAHELGHWEMHAAESQLTICTEADLVDAASYKGSKLEIEANAFAAELLLPTEILRPRCAKVAPSLEKIAEIAEEFSTTLTATAIRFVEECDEPCAVVFSENGTVRRFCTKENQAFWVEPGRAIDRETAAWDCWKGTTPAASSMEQVRLDAWIDKQPRGGAFTLYEQSMRLGRYPTVITLLWLVEVDDY